MMMLTVMVCVVLLLVFVQTVVEVQRDKRVNSVLKRITSLLNTMEIHASVTDNQRERIVTAIDEVKKEALATAEITKVAATIAAADVKYAVECVPDKVVEKIQGVITPGSSDALPIVKPSTQS